MSQDQAGFTPVLYVKKDCPHCLKVRLFLLEARLTPAFDIREFAPGKFMQDSDAIIARIAGERGVDRAALPVFMTYAHGVLPKLQAARKELKALKEQVIA